MRRGGTLPSMSKNEKIKKITKRKKMFFYRSFWGQALGEFLRNVWGGRPTLTPIPNLGGSMYPMGSPHGVLKKGGEVGHPPVWAKAKNSEESQRGKKRFCIGAFGGRIEENSWVVSGA